MWEVRGQGDFCSLASEGLPGRSCSQAGAEAATRAHKETVHSSGHRSWGRRQAGRSRTPAAWGCS